MTSSTEISIKKYLDEFIFDVFLQNLRYYDSINYYMSKNDSDFQLTNEFFRKINKTNMDFMGKRKNCMDKWLGRLPTF